MSTRPVVYTWDGAVMVPEERFMPLCHRQFQKGEQYILEGSTQGWGPADRAYHAALHQAWQNLDEEDTKRFPSEEHFRHWCLIQTGFCSTQDVPCGSAKEARAYGRGVRTGERYAVIEIRGDVVRVIRAESQGSHVKVARRRESAKAVLDLAASMARTTRGELNKNAGRSA